MLSTGVGSMPVVRRNRASALVFRHQVFNHSCLIRMDMVVGHRRWLFGAPIRFTLLSSRGRLGQLSA